MKHFLAQLRSRFHNKLQEQIANTETDDWGLSSKDIQEDVKKLKGLQQRLVSSNTVSDMLLVMQDNSWSLQSALYELLIAADPAISRETMNRLLWRWDT